VTSSSVLPMTPRTACYTLFPYTTLFRSESEGYQFEAAGGSLELLIRRSTSGHREPFETLGVAVRTESRGAEVVAVADLALLVGDEEVTVGATAEDGPVDALDRALREALRPAFPEVDELRLVDFKVRD